MFFVKTKNVNRSGVVVQGEFETLPKGVNKSGEIGVKQELSKHGGKV